MSKKSYTAYFDASGHPDQSETLFLAGFVSTDAKWERFDAAWSDMLARYGLLEFHMKDLASVHDGAPWYGDRAKQQSCFEEAISISKRNTNKTVSIGVIIPDLERARN